jgi:hypothetical protein
MLTRVSLGALLLVSVPALPQAMSPLNPAPTADNDQMATPPPVSGQAYPTAVGAEQRSNYLRGGMMFSGSYIDNMYNGTGAAIAEKTYSILPTMALDETTSRRQLTIDYSPGFTFYQPTSALNQVDQNAGIMFRVRLTPHSALSLSDAFQDSSISFGSAGSANGGSVSGSTPTIAPGIVVPFAKRLTNNALGEYTLQLSRNGMLGVSGAATTLHYPTTSEATGVYDSSSRGGSVFYNNRFFGRQYFGGMYAYTYILSYLPNNGVSTTRLQSFTPFYSLYLGENLSLSVSGGPQYYEVTENPLPTSSSWSPSITASLGWQGVHTNFAASYSQAVTAGGGLVGAYHSRSADAGARWQMSRTWTAGVSAAYAINESASPSLAFGTNSGHTVSGSASLEHPINQQLSLQFGFDRIHQSYGGIQAISVNPDADRGTISLSWQFMHPLGR